MPSLKGIIKETLTIIFASSIKSLNIMTPDSRQSVGNTWGEEEVTLACSYNLGVMSHLHIGHTEMGPKFTISYERLEK